MPQIAGKNVGKIGFGLMGFTWRPNPCPEEQAFAAMREALAQGCNLWNGADFYGTPEHNSMTLLNRYFAKYPEDASKVVISIKGAVNFDKNPPSPDCSPELLNVNISNILKQLGDTGGRVDVFEPARRDRTTPLDVVFGTIQKGFVDKGLVGAIGLSEVSAQSIHDAVKHGNVACVEVELSLWSTDILTNGIAEACGKYNIPIVAYSPLGRGMLVGQFKKWDDIPEGDLRRYMPRFQPDTFDINLQLAEQIRKLAAKKGCTPSQLAIGWCLALQRRPGMPTIIPIPGATTLERVRENSVLVDLSDDEMNEIDATLAKFEVKGDRYADDVPINT